MVQDLRVPWPSDGFPTAMDGALEFSLRFDGPFDEYMYDAMHFTRLDTVVEARSTWRSPAVGLRSPPQIRFSIAPWWLYGRTNKFRGGAECDFRKERCASGWTLEGGTRPLGSGFSREDHNLRLETLIVFQWSDEAVVRNATLNGRWDGCPGQTRGRELRSRGSLSQDANSGDLFRSVRC